MGSFHMAKVTLGVALGCLGKYLKGSGAESIMLESFEFGVNVVESILRGKNYNRSLKGMEYTPASKRSHQIRKGKNFQPL